MSAEIKLVTEIGEAAMKAVDPLANDFIKQINAEARKRGLDGKYVQWVIRRDMNNWPSFPGRNREALNAYRGLADKEWAFDTEGFTMPTMEQEGAVNDAILAVAKWAWDQRRHLAVTYQTALLKWGAKVKSHLKTTTGKDWSDRDALVWTHGALKGYIQDNRLPLPNDIVLYRLIDLVG